MLVCPSCGHSEPDSARFCGNCGNPMPAQSAPESVQAQGAESAATIPSRLEPTPGPATVSEADQSSAGTVATAIPAEAAATEERTPEPVSIPESAPSVEAQTTVRSNPFSQPEMAPTREQPAPPASAVAPSAAPADVICPKCGTANQPSERFCKKCWSPLDQAAGSRPEAPSVPAPEPARQPEPAEAQATAPIPTPVAPPPEPVRAAAAPPPAPAPAPARAATAASAAAATRQATGGGFSIGSIGAGIGFFFTVMFAPATAYQKALASKGSFLSLIIPFLAFVLLFAEHLSETLSNRLLGYGLGVVVGAVFGIVVTAVVAIIAHGVSFVFGYRGSIKQSITIISGGFAAAILYAIIGIVVTIVLGWQILSFAMVGMLWSLTTIIAGFRAARTNVVGAFIVGILSTALVVAAWVGVNSLVARIG